MEIKSQNLMHTSNKSADDRTCYKNPKLHRNWSPEGFKNGSGDHFPSSDYTKILTEHLFHLTSPNERACDSKFKFVYSSHPNASWNNCVTNVAQV